MWRQTLSLATALLLAGVCGGYPPKPLIVLDKPRAYTGKVGLLPAPKGKPDERGVALVADDRTTYPLVEHKGSRILALDGRLRDRPVRLTAMRIPGIDVLLVMRVQTVGDAGFYDVDYWCEICQISLTHPGDCYCCGQEAELRERPSR